MKLIIITYYIILFFLGQFNLLFFYVFENIEKMKKLTKKGIIRIYKIIESNYSIFLVSFS